MRTHDLLEAGSEVGIEVVEHQMHGLVAFGTRPVTESILGRPRSASP